MFSIIICRMVLTGFYLRNTVENSYIYGNTIINHSDRAWIFNSDDNTFYDNILVNNTDGVS